jgi:methyl-galactoside transport system substrate-binding protein
MNKKLLATVLTAAVVLAGCTPKATTPAPAGGTTPAPAAKAPSIGVTIYKFDDNFMSYVRNAITKAATGKAELSLQDSQNDQSKQLEQIDTMIAKGVKSLAINLVDPKAAPSVIDKAQKAKLPVVFFNKEPEAAALKSYDKAWYVGTESKESGEMQGKVVVDSWKANKDKWDLNKDGKIQYVLLKGEPGHPDAEARTKYVIDTIKAAGIEVEALATDTAMWDGIKATEKMDAWLAKNQGKIEYVIANNDGMALGAITALDKAKVSIPVVGVDAIPEALKLIKEGKMVGTVLNDAKNQGQATLDLAVNAANGKDPVADTKWKLDANKAVRVPYVAITKDNIAIAEEAYK